MRELQRIADTFEVSRPVFRLTKHHRDNTISANAHEPVHHYLPTPEEGNVISDLMCSNYREHFYPDIGVFTIDREQIVKSTMNDIRISMANFLEKNLPMRSPTQSKVYRWFYRNMPDDTYFNDVLVMLYKYMRTFCDERMVAVNQKHVENTIALMMAMMEKFDDQN